MTNAKRMRTSAAWAARAAWAAGLLVGGALAAGQTTQPSDLADKVIVLDALFGEGLQRVKESPGKADDLELAGRLLRMAAAPNTSADAVEQFCNTVCDLTEDCAAGRAMAVRALELLAAARPEKREACAGRVIELYYAQLRSTDEDERNAAGRKLVGLLIEAGRRRESAGDDDAALASFRRAMGLAKTYLPGQHAAIKSHHDDLPARRRLAQRLAALREKVAADATDRAARAELVRLYVVDLDDPASAAACLAEEDLGELAFRVRLAARGVEAMPADYCLKLGQWRRELAGSAEPRARPAMLRRALACYERFLSLDGVEEAERAKARADRDALAGELDKLEAAGAPGTLRAARPAPPAPPTAQ